MTRCPYITKAEKNVKEKIWSSPNLSLSESSNTFFKVVRDLEKKVSGKRGRSFFQSHLFRYAIHNSRHDLVRGLGAFTRITLLAAPNGRNPDGQNLRLGTFLTLGKNRTEKLGLLRPCLDDSGPQGYRPIKRNRAEVVNLQRCGCTPNLGRRANRPVLPAVGVGYGSAEAVAIDDGCDDSAVQDMLWPCGVKSLRDEGREGFIAVPKALDAEPLFVARPAAVAKVIRNLILEGLFFHMTYLHDRIAG